MSRVTLTEAERAALDRVWQVSSGGKCGRFDGRYKTGRAIKLCVERGWLRPFSWGWEWTPAGRAALREPQP